MAQYSILQENEICEIANKYELQLIGYELIEEGAGNSSYLLQTSQNKYVLTIFEFELARAVILAKLLLFLDECEFPTTRVLKKASGGMVTISLGKPVLVKPYISGYVVKDLERDMLRQVGRVMARLNDIPAPEFLPDKHAYGLQTFPNVIGRNIDPEYETWLAKQHAFLEQHIPPELPRGLIHGDLFYDNVLFDGNEFKAIIDFEEVCQYYKVFDLGMGIVGMCVEQTSVNMNKVHALVTGYQQVRVLEEREMDILQLFVEYAAIATSSWRYWKYNIDTPIPEKADCHWQMANIAKDVIAIPKAEFIKAVTN